MAFHSSHSCDIFAKFFGHGVKLVRSIFPLYCHALLAILVDSMAIR